MRLTVHPLLLVVLLGVAFTGNVAMYSLILISLVFHECGHLVAAKSVGAHVERCTIMPYGGEIIVKNEYQLNEVQLLVIALGGPLASLVGIVLASFLPAALAQPLMDYQLILLAVNSIPIWPLDGGKVVCYTMLIFFPKVKIYETFLSLSLCFLTIIILIALWYLDTVFILLLSLFLWWQVFKEWRIRKYRSAFQKHVLNRLT